MTTLNASLVLSLVDRASAPARAISGALAGLDKRLAGLRAFGATIGRFAAIGAGYVGATAGLEGTLGAARQFQASMTELGVKTGLTDAQLGVLRNRIVGLSGPTNQTVQDLVAGVDTMVGLGLSAEQAAAAIPAIGKAATATGATMADLSAAATSAMQNLKIAPEEIGRLLDSLAAAGNMGAFELRDQAQYLPALGAAYQALGQTGVSAATDLAAALQIVRTGTGDSASAATNLQNVLQKINAPQTRAAFKKMGVNLEREMTKASKKGLTPIEALAEVTNKTLKGDLSKLGDLFSDAQVQQGLRPLIQSIEDYRKIRDEAGRASGTVDEAFARRMKDANERLKALQIRIGNAGTAIGANMLEPIAKAADYLVNVFDTLDQRVTAFDKVGAAVKGFLAGFGVKTGDGNALTQIRDFIFGVETDGAKAADQLGEIAAQFRSYGEALSDNPIAKFCVELSAAIGVLAMSKSGRIFIVAYGISALVGAVQGAKSISEFVEALKGLSALEWAGIGAGLLIVAGKVSRLIGLFRELAKVTPKPGTKLPTPTAAPGGGITAGISAWVAGLTAAFAAASLNLGQSDLLKTDAEKERDRYLKQRLRDRFQYPDATHDEERERDRSLDGWAQSPRPGGIHDVLNPPASSTIQKMLDGMSKAAGPQSSLADPIGALKSTILQTRQQGVADVKVVNPIRPNVSVTVNQNVTMQQAPAEAARAAADATGQSIQSAVEGALQDGWQ